MPESGCVSVPGGRGSVSSKPDTAGCMWVILSPVRRRPLSCLLGARDGILPPLRGSSATLWEGKNPLAKEPRNGGEPEPMIILPPLRGSIATLWEGKNPLAKEPRSGGEPEPITYRRCAAPLRPSGRGKNPFAKEPRSGGDAHSAMTRS